MPHSSRPQTTANSNGNTGYGRRGTKRRWRDRQIANPAIHAARVAPHIAEELWANLHAARGTQPAPTLTYAAWPKFDAALLVEDTLEIPVQVNGKLRDVIKVPATASQADLEAAALASDKVKPFLEGKTIRKIIVLPRKLVNIVAK